MEKFNAFVFVNSRKFSSLVFCFSILQIFFPPKDHKPFSVSSTPTISRSSSVSGVDMAGLQTSFLSQVRACSYMLSSTLSDGTGTCGCSVRLTVTVTLLGRGDHQNLVLIEVKKYR